jgi:3-deoxy-D-manno-octulosonic-acid transferase
MLNDERFVGVSILMLTFLPYACLMNSRFPSTWGMRLAIAIYQVLWIVLLPFFLVYLWQKGKREPLYRQFWRERWGQVSTQLKHPIWVHSASMGEIRGAAPLIRALLSEGYPVLVTTLTPAGRTAAQKLLEQAIQSGQAEVAFVPFELSGSVKRFIRNVQPRCAMMTEIDTWPILLTSIRAMKVPLCMANAQYPKKSIERDLRQWGGFRSKLFAAYQLVMCKSETHAQRFRQVGCQHVAVVGETRFDLPVSAQQIAAAGACVSQWQLNLNQRPVLAFASAIAGEDEQFIDAMRLIQKGVAEAGQSKPLFIYVPRSPQRFDDIYSMFQTAGLTTLRRSQIFNSELVLIHPDLKIQDTDVLLGDSLGEMYFYLALSQAVVVGASFVPLGAHNVIEPLALKKPVMVGHSIWGIEYPGVEALAAGVLQQHMTIPSLAEAVVHLLTDPSAYATAMSGAESFYAEHAGSTQKHMAVLKPWLESL